MPPVGRVLTAAWILPVSGPPIANGAVAEKDGRICWIGPRAQAPPGPVVDLGSGVLLPGLVNAHCHLELSHLAYLCRQGRGFVPWVESLVRERGVSANKAAKGLTDAVAWLERETATVAIGDISNTLDSVPVLVRSRLRAVVFQELIGWDPARAEAALELADRRFEEMAPAGDRVTVRLAAHAPHSVSPALFARLVERNGPATVHLAESTAEAAFLRDGGGEWPAFLAARGLQHVAFTPPGVSPVAYLERLGALREKVLVAHAVQTDEADAALLARRGAIVVLCPRSNRNLGVGKAPVGRLLAAGVRICLGTDSLASADDIDVAHEMAELRRQQPDLAPRDIIRMATAEGAEALGFRDLGTLEPGRAALYSYAAAENAPEDPEAFVVSSAELRRVA